MPQELDVRTIILQLTGCPFLKVLVTAERGETPVFGDNDLLATRELVHRSSKGLDGSSPVGIPSTDGYEDLPDIHTSNCPVRLSPSTTHASLESIGTGTGQHLVDPDNMERVCPDSDVEVVFPGKSHQVSVGADTGSFQSLRRKLLILVGN